MLLEGCGDARPGELDGPSRMTLAPPTDAPHVELSHVRVAFGDREVLRDLSCRFPRDRISVILGGSGSGKSTLLRTIGGLVRPQAGSVVVDGEDITKLSERELFRVRKKLGMMFQQGALLDSLTVFDNLAFPLREHTRLRADEITAAVHACVEAVGLQNVDGLLPGQLSGGMVKRVALARAIVREPVILLCDEPFSGLDPISARRIEALLVDINRQRGVTLIVVSHSIPSTMRMADHVVVLLPDGPVEGTPAELHASTDPRIIAFLSDGADPAVAAPDDLPGTTAVRSPA
jgi:phospholipid/cholesterol/gamma-HCH transport system ATP-binding protein